MTSGPHSAIDHLRELPFVSDSRQDGARLELAVHGETYALRVFSQRAISSDDISRLAALAPSSEPPLVVANHVGHELGARLRSAALSYVDDAGNLFLQLRDPATKAVRHSALVQGNRPTKQRPKERAWRAPSYQTLFALLAEPTLLSATTREIAASSGTSTTPVLQVREKLIALGLLTRFRREFQWAPGGRDKAIDLWVSGYPMTLRPSLLVGCARPRASLNTEQVEAAIQEAFGGRVDFRWGGAAATYRLDGYYRGDRTVVHVDASEMSDAAIMAALRMIPDPDGPVVILRSPGPQAWTSPVPMVVHPLLAWTELMDEGHDRATEAALRLRGKL